MKIRELLENNIIHSKFAQKLAHKKGMFMQDIKIPKSLKDGKPFVRFEVSDSERPGSSAATIIGIKADGTKEKCGTTRKDVAHVLCKTYNAGGYSTEEIQPVKLSDIFDK